MDPVGADCIARVHLDYYCRHHLRNGNQHTVCWNDGTSPLSMIRLMHGRQCERSKSVQGLRLELRISMPSATDLLGSRRKLDHIDTLLRPGRFRRTTPPQIPNTVAVLKPRTTPLSLQSRHIGSTRQVLAIFKFLQFRLFYLHVGRFHLLWQIRTHFERILQLRSSRKCAWARKLPG